MKSHHTMSLDCKNENFANELVELVNKYIKELMDRINSNCIKWASLGCYGCDIEFDQNESSIIASKLIEVYQHMGISIEIGRKYRGKTWFSFYWQ